MHAFSSLGLSSAFSREILASQRLTCFYFRSNNRVIRKLTSQLYHILSTGDLHYA